MLRIAIFNDDIHQYAIFEHIIHWCHVYQHSLTIYVNNDKNEWIDCHKIRNLQPIDKFKTECHNYHIIFTTANCKNKYIHLYDLERTIVAIDHSSFQEQLILEQDQYIIFFDDQIRKLFPQLYVNSVISQIKIPRILHLMWLSPNNDPIPAKYLPNIEQYRLYNPEFELRMWNMEHAQNFLQQVNPKYYDFFQQLNLIISKCDFFRMVVIYYLGGIYSDLDFYCMSSLDPLLDQQEIVIFEEVPEHEPTCKQLTNAILAATPLHPFIGGWIENIIQTMSLLPPIGVHSVMQTTGPIAFWRYYESVPSKPPLSDTCTVMPFTSQHRRSKICPSNQSITHTIWNEGSGWGDGASFAWTGAIIVIIVVIIAGIIISRLIN